MGRLRGLSLTLDTSVSEFTEQDFQGTLAWLKQINVWLTGSFRKLTEIRLGVQEVYWGLNLEKGEERRKQVGQKGPQSAMQI